MADDLADASKGFDALFNDSIDAARDVFKARDSPFHQLGFAALSFLEAALGFEVLAVHRILVFAWLMQPALD